MSALQMVCIRYMAEGYTPAETARRFQHKLVPYERDPDKRLKQARGKIRRWARTKKFRDLLWEEAVTQLDLETPGIVNGIVRKAKAGRVDAARLALELNGRHAPNVEIQPAQINVVLGVPRPPAELEAPIEDADFEELE